MTTEDAPVLGEEIYTLIDTLLNEGYTEEEINDVLTDKDFLDQLDSWFIKEAKSKTKRAQELAIDTDLVHDQDGYTIHKLNSHKAAVQHGRNAKWCPGLPNATGERLYNQYSCQAPLHVVRTPGQEKYMYWNN